MRWQTSEHASVVPVASRQRTLKLIDPTEGCYAQGCTYRIMRFPTNVSLGTLGRRGPEEQEWLPLGQAPGEIGIGAGDELEL